MEAQKELALWFAFNLVTLWYRKQPSALDKHKDVVVICFQFSNFVI